MLFFGEAYLLRIKKNLNQFKFGFKTQTDFWFGIV